MSEAIVPRTTVSGPSGAGIRSARYAAYIFWLMFLINLINYVDRWVFSALSDIIRVQLSFSLFQIGVLSSAFLLVYTIVAYPLGVIADHLSRKRVVAAGLALWSVATGMTALAAGFPSMLLARAFVGVGEGSYYPAGTPMLVAWYPPRRRADILARWGVGSLIGIGVGFLVGSLLAGPQWRLAFVITAVPGLILALLIWRTRERERSEDDPLDAAQGRQQGIWRKARSFLGIRTLRVILAIHALGFFALATLATYLVIYLGATYGTSAYHHAGLSAKVVVLVPGVVLIIGGIAGNLPGGAWADRMSQHDAGARVKTGALGFLLAAPCLVLTLLAPMLLHAIPAYAAASERTQVLLGTLCFIMLATLATICVNIYSGPTSAALQDVLAPADRGAGGGLELTLAHLFGDSWSPAAVGALAVVLNNQIWLALLLTCPLVLVLAGIVGIWGSRFYARDVGAVGASLATTLGVTPD